MNQTSSRSIIVKRIIIIVSAALWGAAGFFLNLMHKDPNPNRPERIDGGLGRLGRCGRVEFH